MTRHDFTNASHYFPTVRLNEDFEHRLGWYCADDMAGLCEHFVKTRWKVLGSICDLDGDTQFLTAGLKAN